MTPSLTRIIRTLAERGLVIRAKDGGDGRRLVLSITPQALALIDAMTPEIATVYEQLEAEFGKKKLEQMLDILEQLADTHP